MRTGLNWYAKVLAASVLVLLLAAESAQAESGGAPGRRAAAVFDVVVLRPFYAVSTVVGVALFVPAAVVTSPGGRSAIADAWDSFVVAPADQAFKSPLGEF